MENRSQRILVLLSFFAIYVIWGSTYLLNKVAVSELPPFMLAGFRFTIASVLIFGLAALMGKSLKITPRQLWNTAVAGFLFLSFGNGVVVWALKYVDSNFAALEISAQPLIVLLMMWGIRGQAIRPMSMIGILLGILGIYLLVNQDAVIRDQYAWAGVAMIFAAMLAWGYGSLFVGTADLPRNTFVNTGYQMATGGVMLMGMSWALGETWTNPLDWQAQTHWSMLLLILFGSIAAFTAFNFLLKTVSPEKVSTNTYVNPIVAMLFGWLYLDETISAQSVVAAVILLTGVYFINVHRNPIRSRWFRSKAH
ncbi:EamA family transporter [Robiginitalea sp. M366]|uniref:EamA family transporter n=1 Tax=Robiginitalea aestuariiviva TaxID=3036903 RepID=UPI00240CF757|nr:EamA family transporter [Robiginitalea aestuariiviva]MDG1572911.1 EamA family transporter [Robiginitalea aestuariiviva]